MLRAAVLVGLVFPLGAACGRGPWSASCPAPDACPPGSEARGPGRCVSQEPLSTTPGRLAIGCSVDWAGVEHFAIVDGRVAMSQDEVLARVETSPHEVCEKTEEFERALAPGWHTVLHARKIYSVAVAHVVFPDGALADDNNVRGGAYLRAESLFAVPETRPPGAPRTSVRELKLVDALVAPGELDLRVAAFDGTPVLIDQLVIEWKGAVPADRRRGSIGAGRAGRGGGAGRDGARRPRPLHAAGLRGRGERPEPHARRVRLP